jgi:hypothetical protein
MHNTPPLPVSDEELHRKALLAMATGVTDAISPFSSWMIAGAGAIMAVVISHQPAAAAYLDIGNVRHATLLFLYAAGLNMLQRWLGARVSALAAVTKAMESTHATPTQVAELRRRLIQITYWPTRWDMARRLNRTDADANLAPFVLCAQFAQFQWYLLFAQMVLLLLIGCLLLPF